MANVKKLLAAAVDALDAGAEDLAADFIARALQELRPAQPDEKALPWSGNPGDPRIGEWYRRAVAFLDAFASAPNSELTEADAQDLARRVFPEQPRVVGPGFYRPGFVETIDRRDGPSVRLTKEGQRYLSNMERKLAEAVRAKRTR